METYSFCQSCTMPIENDENQGTEKDGSKSKMYCKYCYKDGAFTDPDMTLEKMLEIAKTEMQKQNIPAYIIQQSVNMLPGLKRWKK